MSLEKFKAICGSHLGGNHASEVLLNGDKINGMKLPFACNDMQRTSKHLIFALLPMELFADSDAFEGKGLVMRPILLHFLYLCPIGTIVEYILHTILSDVMHCMDTFVSRESNFLTFHYTYMKHRFQLVALVHHITKNLRSKFSEILFSAKRNQSTEFQASRTIDHFVRIVIGKEILSWTMGFTINHQPIGYITLGPCHDILVIRIFNVRDVLSDT